MFWVRLSAFSAVSKHVYSLPWVLIQISYLLFLFACYANHVDDHNHKGLFQLLHCFCLSDPYLGNIVINTSLSNFIQNNIMILLSWYFGGLESVL